MRRTRRNPDFKEEGASTVGWANLPIYIGALAFAVYLYSTNQLQNQSTAPAPSQDPSVAYPGFSMLAASDQAQVLNAPEYQRQGIINQILSRQASSGMTIDPSFISIKKA